MDADLALVLGLIFVLEFVMFLIVFYLLKNHIPVLSANLVFVQPVFVILLETNIV